MSFDFRFNATELEFAEIKVPSLCFLMRVKTYETGLFILPRFRLEFLGGHR